MTTNGSFGLKGFALIFAALVITFASDGGAPGGRFDRLTKIVRNNPSVSKPGTVDVSATTTGTTSPAPTTTTTTSSNTLYPELTAIASNFDTATEIQPGCNYTGGNVGCVPVSGLPDVVGAFRFLCGAGQVLRDDPIVYPGQPGASHLHQFFGNLGANASSTYSSLRTTGETTCTSKLNRSAYWMPAMLDGKGSVVRPDYVAVYYKRRPITDPKCSLTSGDPRAEGNCIPLPNGLRFIAGFDMVTNTPKTGAAYFNCDGPTGVQGHYASIGEAASHCPTTPTLVRQWDGSMLPTYNRIGAVINMPNCWDGVNLDSANHRSHVSYGSYGDWGFYKCPATHPFVIPTFTMGVWFSVDANLATWHLSSDEMMPNTVAGSTFHADWFGAWDNGAEAMWMDNCINKLLNCSAGEFGNGKQMIQNAASKFTASPRLVPVP